MFPTKTGTHAGDDRVFGSADVSRIARVSLRQLQWWDERKVASPGQKEHRRVYRSGEVIEIMVVAELRRKGITLQKIRGIIRGLRRKMATDPQVRAASDLYLLTDGTSVHLEESAEQVVRLLKRARRPMFLVSVGDHVKRLAFEKSSIRSDKQMKLF